MLTRGISEHRRELCFDAGSGVGGSEDLLLHVHATIGLKASLLFHAQGLQGQGTTPRIRKPEYRTETEASLQRRWRWSSREVLSAVPIRLVLECTELKLLAPDPV